MSIIIIIINIHNIIQLLQTSVVSETLLTEGQVRSYVIGDGVSCGSEK